MNYRLRFMTLTGDRDQDHPHGKEVQKAKWLSGEVLQIAVKRREAKSKGEKERYKHLNAEFQIIARRDKKTSRLNKINFKIQQKSKQIRLQHFFH